MRLHEMSAEHILDEIEKRSEALLEADEEFGEVDANFKAYEASMAMARKDAGCKSMTEAEKQVRSTGEWITHYVKLQKLRAKAAHAKRHYQMAIIAQDLWRTERASMRAA